MKILNAEPENYSSQAHDTLKKFGHVDNGPLTRIQLQAVLGNYDVLIIRLGHILDRRMIAQGHTLKAIVTATTGLNHIDLNAAAESAIEIISLKGEYEFLDNIHATAEHTVALMLGLARHLPQACNDVKKNRWRRDAFKGMELHGKTLGIIGYGRLGRKVAGYAQALGMRCLACDIHPVVDGTVEFVSLVDLLQTSDIVSLHASYSIENENMIDVSAFERMKKNSLFINTARGELVDEAALLASLQNGRLAGAALDVLHGENTGARNWLRRDPLIRYARRHDNLLITPHIGGATLESMEKTEIFMAEKLKKWAEEKFLP